MKIAIIGTGFAAKLRADTLGKIDRCQLVAVAGGDRNRTEAFANQFAIRAFPHCSAVLAETTPDLVFVSTINSDHAAIARQVLEAGKHVVVEYPLAFDLDEARSLLELARSRELLLHVEHVELLSGPHLALKTELPAIGEVFYAESVTLKAVRPAPDRWTYRPRSFGFPLVGALSRVHRLMDLFGSVDRVSCQLRLWGESLPEVYSSCMCSAQLSFANGVVADVSYGKGEAIWRSRRTTEIYGREGAILLGDDRDSTISPSGIRSITVGSRRGLFARDTQNVIQHLLDNKPLYVTPEASLRSLEVALAAERAAATNQTVRLPLEP